MTAEQGNNPEWFVMINGKEHGPLTRGQVEVLVQSNVVQAETMLRRASSETWKAARKFKGLLPDSKPTSDSSSIGLRKSPKSTFQPETTTKPVKRKPRTLAEVIAREVEKEERDTAFNIKLGVISCCLLIGFVVFYITGTDFDYRMNLISRILISLAAMGGLGLICFPIYAYQYMPETRSVFDRIGTILGGLVIGVVAITMVSVLIYVTLLSPDAQMWRARSRNSTELLELVQSHFANFEGSDLVQEAVPQKRILVVEQRPKEQTLRISPLNRWLPLNRQCATSDELELILLIRTTGDVYTSPGSYFEYVRGSTRKLYHLENWIFEATLFDVAQNKVLVRTIGHSTHGSAGSAEKKGGGGYGFSFSDDPWPKDFLGQYQ